MSLLNFGEDTSILFGCGKQAAAGQGVELSGLLQLTKLRGAECLVVSVPVALVRGVFSAMTSPGIELPTDTDGRVTSCIQVVTDQELATVTRPERFTADRGKAFAYRIGKVHETDAGGKDGISKSWAMRIDSPQLSLLRRTHGLPPMEFWLPVAVRRVGVLGNNPIAKNSAATLEDLETANKTTDTTPTPAQRDAGNYRKGKITVEGLEISIENPAGSTRSGTGKDGKPWSVTLVDSYGYIRGTQGKDGDHVDIFIGPDLETQHANVFIVNQNDPDTGKFDEHKCVIGVKDEAAAKALYTRNYSAGWKGFDSVKSMPLDEFKKWVTTPKETASPA